LVSVACRDAAATNVSERKEKKRRESLSVHNENRIVLVRPKTTCATGELSTVTGHNFDTAIEYGTISV
jgi:hypothetical protein